MLLLYYSLHLLLLLVAPSHAESTWDKYTFADYQVYACEVAVVGGKASIKAAAFAPVCEDKTLMGSVMNCIYELKGLNNTEMEDCVLEICAENDVVYTQEDLYSIYSNATKYLVEVDTKKELAKIDTSVYPVGGSYIQSTALGYAHAFYSRYQNINFSHYVGIGAIAYWFFVIFASGLINWGYHLTISSKKGGSHISNNMLVNCYRKNVTLAPTFTQKHIESNGSLGFIPSRTETIILGVWILYCTLGTAVLGVQFHSDDLIFFTKSSGMARYYGDRSAIVMCYQFPLLFLFPGRNNFLQWITRWQYSRFVHLHKWIGRVLFLEIIVHTITMTISSYKTGKIVTRIKADWFIDGIVATAAAFAMLVTAAYIVRKYYYEIFLFLHIALAAVVLAFSYLHADSQDFGQYFYACVGVWCFDRFLRLVRIIIFGLNKANIELVSDDTMKVTIKHSRFWKPQPGAHCYIHFLKKFHFLQSHPFSVINNESNEIVFYCRAKKGITGYLQGKLVSSQSKSMSLYCIVEGPYGHSTPYHHFDRSVLVAGGNGITGVYSYVHDLSERYLQSGTKKEVVLYWGVRNLEVLRWFGEELQRLRKSQDFVKVIIYVSEKNLLIESSNSETDSSSNKSEDISGDNENSSYEKEIFSDKDATYKLSISTADQLKEAFSFIEFRKGRIDVNSIVEQELKACEANSSLAVGCCGPPAVNDILRNKLRNSLDNDSGVRIDYFEEAQAW